MLKELERVRAERSLANFVRLFWHELEPHTRPLIWNWHLDAICAHLEAVTYGDITRLLMNVPPGAMKSMLVNVFWPAWEWGPCNRPATRYITASYSQHLTVRDNQRFLRLITSPLYRELWGDRFGINREGEEKVQNDRTGWKIATSVGGVGTGERGDRVIIDDPHNVKDAESEAKRLEAINWFTEVVPTRVNDPDKSAFVVIMQRVHQEDVSGVITNEKNHGYVHMMVPMEYDPMRHCETHLDGEDEVFFSDPRTVEGELYWEARFPARVVERDKLLMGPYAVASQFQQEPAPRGGGIIQDKWWKLWPPEGEKFRPDGQPLRPNEFPPMTFILASLDTAMTEKTRNDPSALTIWGCWTDKGGSPKIMLLYAWEGRLEFHALVEQTIKLCSVKGREVDVLLIEAKANGISVAQEVVRLMQDQIWSTHLMQVKSDKVARLYSVQPLFSGGLVYAPDRSWADKVMNQCSIFPKGKHDDLVDTVSQALSYLRLTGMALLREEEQIDKMRKLRFTPASERAPVYDI